MTAHLIEAVRLLRNVARTLLSDWAESLTPRSVPARSLRPSVGQGSDGVEAG